MTNERLQALFTLPMDEQLRLFGDMRALYPTRSVARGRKVSDLKRAAPLDLIYESDGEKRDIAEFMRRYRAAGLLILKRGEVVCERYALGQTRETPWISFSMAKSISSTLVGAAIEDGLIASLDEPVVRTVPELRGSAYEGVTIRNVLQMSSGVRWNETYLDPHSDRRRLLTLQASEEPGAVLTYLRQLPRAAEPGTVFNYNTAETFLLGEILSGALKRPLSDYLSEKIWQPCGMEADAYWQLESPEGHEFAGSGLSATLRDYARFAAFVLADGVAGGKRVLPEGWMADATSVTPGSPLEPGKLAGFEPLGYGYQWWTFPSPLGRRIFAAVGIFGQQIYIDVDERLAIVLTGAWPQPIHDPSRFESYVFFSAVTRALQDR